MSPPDTAVCSIREASARTGISVDTLRYYERVGLMPEIARTTGGQRTYTSDDLGWITFVRRLRATGMPVDTVATYAAMVRRGDGTIEQRRGLLAAHRARVAAAIDELSTALAMLDHKLEHYEAVETVRTIN